MIEECRKLVELKRVIDLKMQSMADARTICCSASRASVMPLNFLRKVLPFWQDDIIDRIENGTVDSRQILGGTYNDYPGALITDQYLNNINQNSAAGYDKPSYHKVGAFPLYVAGEGKNRVKIFAERNLKIVCKEKLTSYPEASSLKIHRRYFHDDIHFLSCDDPNFIDERGELVEIVFPNYTLPLLRKYGVSDGKPVFKLFHKSAENQILHELTKCLMSS